LQPKPLGIVNGILNVEAARDKAKAKAEAVTIKSQV
jgi:hypothetical protein